MNSAATLTSRFFVAGGTLSGDAECYVLRRADQQLYVSLWSGDFAYVLTSRQMGKSSLMVRTAKKLRSEGLLVAVIDLTVLGQNVTAAQWYFTMAERIAQQIGVQELEVERAFKSPSKSPLQRWVQFIENLLRLSDRRSVIFIDEVDLVQTLPFATDEFFASIRQFYNRRSEEPPFERLAFCLLGVAAPSHLIRDPQLTPFNIGTRIELADFSREEAAVLARGLGDRDSAKRRLDRVLYWTGGHPYLAQRLCQSVANQNGSADVDEVCSTIFLGERARERDDNLLFVRERILNSRSDLSGLLTIYLKILRRKSVRDDETNPIISELRLSGICKPVAGKLRVRNPIYERVFNKQWIRDSMPGAEVRRQRIAFRRGVIVTTLIAAAAISIMVALAAMVVGQRNRIQHQLYVSDMTLAEQAWDHHAPQRTLELLTRHIPKAGEQDLRGFEWFMLWNLCNARRPVRDIVAGAEVYSGTASSDLKEIFLTSVDGNLVALDSTAGSLLRSVKLNGLAEAIAASPDGRFVATAGRSGVLTVWNASTLEKIVSRTARSSLVALSFSADNRWLVGAAGTSISVWRVPDFVEVADHDQGGDTIRAVAISSDGQMVGFADRNIFEVWSRDFSHLIARFPVNQPGSISFCPNGRCVAVSYYSTVDLIDLNTKQRLHSLKGDWGFGGGGSFSPDGKRLTNIGADGTVRIWDVASGVQLDMFIVNSPASFSLSTDWHRIVVFGRTRHITIWNAEEIAPNPHAEDEIYSLAFAPDESVLISGSNDAKLSVWNTEKRNLLSSINVGERIEHIYFLTSNQVLVNSTHQVFTLDIGTGVRTSTWASSRGHLIAALSPDHQTWAKSDDDSKEIVLTSVSTGQVLARRTFSTSAHALAISPDGNSIAASVDEGDLAGSSQGRLPETLSGCQYSSVALAFSPDGRFLLEGCTGTGKINVWDWASRKLKVTLQGHRESIKSLQYSPDGRRFVSTSDDGSVCIWDATSFEILMVRDESTMSIETAAFSPEGRYLAVAGDDHRIRVWDAGANPK